MFSHVMIGTNDLEKAKSVDFYARVGSLGRIFIDIETEAFAIPA